MLMNFLHRIYNVLKKKYIQEQSASFTSEASPTGATASERSTFGGTST